MRMVECAHRPFPLRGGLPCGSPIVEGKGATGTTVIILGSLVRGRGRSGFQDFPVLLIAQPHLLPPQTEGAEE
ncbi:MAG: hypothetical protein N2170_00775 [Bacteroidia bacterium]|nr:hypothetical protein [Bacteroidia bacterium]